MTERARAAASTPGAASPSSGGWSRRLGQLLPFVVFLVAHEGLIRLVAQGDLVAQVVAERSLGWLLLAALLYAVRLVLVLVLPGWLLWLTITWAYGGFASARRDSAARSPGARRPRRR